MRKPLVLLDTIPDMSHFVCQNICWSGQRSSEFFAVLVCPLGLANNLIIPHNVGILSVLCSFLLSVSSFQIKFWM